MTEHDPAFNDPQRHGVEHIFRAVESSVGFLQLAADHNVDVGAIHCRRRIANSQLDVTNFHVGIADRANRIRQIVNVDHWRGLVNAARGGTALNL